MKPPAIVILGEASIPISHQIQAALPEAMVYGLADRVQSTVITYENFGDTVREFFRLERPLLAFVQQES